MKNSLTKMFFGIVTKDNLKINKSFSFDLLNQILLFNKIKRAFILPLLMIGLLFSTTVGYSQIQKVPVTVPAGGFHIDGDLKANTPTSGVGDWLSGAGGTGGYVINNDGTVVNSLTSGHRIDGYKGGPAEMSFTSGSKFNDNPNSWTWNTGDAGGKGDINNVLYHIGNDSSTNEQWIIVAGDRKETNGTSYIDFEFLQNTLTRNTSGNPLGAII